MKQLAIIVLLCSVVIPESLSAEEARGRVVVRIYQGGTLAQAVVYSGRHVMLSYGYFTALHRESNGVPFATVSLYDDEEADTFIHLNERNEVVFFTIYHYASAEFGVFYCNESDDSRRRCGEMQARWNELFLGYGLERRISRALGR